MLEQSLGLFFFLSFSWASSLPVRWNFRTSILSGFPGAARKLVVPVLKVFWVETMKGAPFIKILFWLSLFFFCFVFVAAFAGSDGYSMSGGCNPLIVCALVCPSVSARSLHCLSMADLGMLQNKLT